MFAWTKGLYVFTKLPLGTAFLLACCLTAFVALCHRQLPEHVSNSLETTVPHWSLGCEGCCTGIKFSLMPWVTQLRAILAVLVTLLVLLRSVCNTGAQMCNTNLPSSKASGFEAAVSICMFSCTYRVYVIS